MLKTCVRLKRVYDHFANLAAWDSFIGRYGAVGIRNLLRIFNPSLPSVFMQVEELTLLPVLRRIHGAVGRHRQRLYHINSIDHVVALLQASQRIMVISGAGVSVSSGIPDFRSPTGIYSRLGEFNLESPADMFDIAFFKKSPQAFYSFAKEIYPLKFQPSVTHRFIKLLQDRGKLLRNYSQNIDALEQKAGIERVVQCHGSFATCSCLTCHFQRPGNAIEDEILNQKIPKCPQCPPEANALVKPDIVFFGEPLPSTFDFHIDKDHTNADLVIVIGSSLKVAPVAAISDMIPPNVPQILINMEALPHMKYFDVQLLGHCDEIVSDLCSRCGWDLPSAIAVEPPRFVAPNKYVYRGGVISDVHTADIRVALMDSRKSVRSRTTTTGTDSSLAVSPPVAPTWHHIESDREELNDSDQESIRSNEGNADDDQSDMGDVGPAKRKRDDMEDEVLEKRHRTNK